MRMARRLPTLFASVLTLYGCAGDAGVDGGPGADSITRAPEVAGELVHFCEQGQALLGVIDELNTDPQLVCTVQGLDARFAGDGHVSICEAARDSCLAADPGGPEDHAALDCDAEHITEQGLSACEVTIEQLDTCKVAFEALLTEMQEELRCDMSPDKAIEMYALHQQGAPLECGPVIEMCPLFIDAVASQPEPPEPESGPEHYHPPPPEGLPPVPAPPDTLGPGFVDLSESLFEPPRSCSSRGAAPIYRARRPPCSATSMGTALRR
jgi:hypothetical protein